MKLTWWTIIVEIIKGLLRPKPKPPPPEPPQEWVVTPGQHITQEINIAGGSVEFDVWVPEAGRADDWKKAAILELWQAQDLKQGPYGEIMPYKIKACSDSTCKEPRYNVLWDQWRHCRVSWDRVGLTLVIDGTRVSVSWLAPWADGRPVYATIGDRPGGLRHLEGARYRGITWS